MPLPPVRVRSLTTGVATGAATAVGAACLTVASIVPAHADRAEDAPVTADDRVTVSGSYTGADYAGGQSVLVDVLANDRDPNGDELAVCRVEVPAGAPLVVAETTSAAWRGTSAPTALRVVATGNRAASYAVRYWACDHDYLTPATLTVTVRPVEPVRATVLRKRHRVRFTNPLQRAVRVEWGGLRGQDPDGSVRIRPGRSRVVDVERRNLVWIAMTRTRSTPVGIGVLRGLRP
ncbi:hypothetical protein ABFT23_21160 [Nocardioides sp. C4-1]|uniref:hypothetical protein n=1 Tax=Nocardioides sp. C4-1 TaxID=3151851 RepID=UPI0032661817